MRAVDFFFFSYHRNNFYKDSTIIILKDMMNIIHQTESRTILFIKHHRAIFKQY